MKKRELIIIIFILAIMIPLLYRLSTNKALQTTNTNKIDSDEIAPVTEQSGEVLSENIVLDSEPTNNALIDLSNIKAVYSSGWVAGGATSRAEMIQNITSYGFNAVVLDIKDEAGHLSYASNVPVALEIGSNKNMIKDIKSVLEEFHQNDIYVIGRIVTFKDPTYANAIKNISYQRQDGSYWTDRSGNYWPNPYNRASWDYPLALAHEAAELGFDEIQFDYVRFPSSEGKVSQIAYGFDSNTTNKSQIINQFLSKAMDELADMHVKVSADVFGITTRKDGDFENIGQDYKAIAGIVDVICPMIYPSHYGRGEYRIAKPDLEPYSIVYYAMLDASNRVSGEAKTAIARPYLQDFTASWLGRGNYKTYDSEAVKYQIMACIDAGIQSFTLWDPNNKYCYDALNLAKDAYK